MSSTILTGTFGAIAAGAGFPASALSGAEPSGPITSFTLYAEQKPVPENPDIHLHVAPNTGGSDGGSSDDQPDDDGFGVFYIAASTTMVYTPEVAVNRWANANGFTILPNGIMGSQITGVSSDVTYPISFRLTLSYKDPEVPADWFNPGPGPITNVNHVDDRLSAYQGDPLDPQYPIPHNDEEFTFDLPVEPDTGTIIKRSDGMGGPKTTIVLNNGETTFIDTVPTGENYFYEFWSYYLNGDGVSEVWWMWVYTFDFGTGIPAPTPDVDFSGGEGGDSSETGTGGIDLGGSAPLVLITDPSGLYGLIEGKLHDTLYNRADTDSVDVRIPTPFIKTAFLPNK